MTGGYLTDFEHLHSEDGFLVKTSFRLLLRHDRLE